MYVRAYVCMHVCVCLYVSFDLCIRVWGPVCVESG